MKIEDVIKLPEGKTIEFKENAESRAKILATVIAFSNTSGGRIIIGVKDKTKQLVGINNPQELSEALVNMIHDSVEPKLLPNLEVISFRNKHLIIIEIYPSALRPHYERSKGKLKSAYIRIGPTTRLADSDLLKAIERSALPKTFDEELCYESSCEEIDLREVAQLFTHQRKLTTNDLVTLGVYAKDRETLIPTVGGVLLFSKNRLKYFPDAWVQLGVFEGKDKREILSNQKITGSLPETVDEAMSFIKKNLRVGLKIENIKHTEVWEIPRVALREALINAIVHTDYSLKGAPIRVAIFSDRIEIENSGLLLWGLTIEDLKMGISKLRNPVIARAFNELNLIEQWGSGIRRMIGACEEAGLPPPLFEEIGPRIRVTFFKQQIRKATIDTVDEKIINFLKERGPLPTHEIEKLIGLSRRTVINRMAQLVNKGVIVEISTGPTDPKKLYTLR